LTIIPNHLPDIRKMVKFYIIQVQALN